MMAKHIPNRPNKQAIGFTKHYENSKQVRITNPKHPKYNDVKSRIIGALIVYGTLDVLARRNGVMRLAKRTKKEHPIDKGYFKEVYILSDHGKFVLKHPEYRLNKNVE